MGRQAPPVLATRIEDTTQAMQRLIIVNGNITQIRVLLAQVKAQPWRLRRNRHLTATANALNDLNWLLLQLNQAAIEANMTWFSQVAAAITETAGKRGTGQ